MILIAAKANKKDLDEEKLNCLITPSAPEVQENEKPMKQKQISVLDVFKYPNLRKKTLIIFFDW